MSGIAGILRFAGPRIEPGQVQAMMRTMAHRGPDGFNYREAESFALGHGMMWTTPESLEESQPLANESGNLVLVMDGRVDNWEELRRELLQRGAVLRTRSDAELVLRAYELWGRDCLPRIDGDFAFVICDSRDATAFCARDRMGNKPLHYHWDGSTFSFASEPQAILSLPWVRAVPNEGMFAEYVAAEWHSRDETLWVGVLRLVPAHSLDVGPGGPRARKYWEPDLWASLPYTRDEEYFEHYREVLTESVRRMSRSHRPVSCHVSGGLDSSAVFSAAHHLARQQRLPAPGLQGHMLAFPDHPEADERAYSRAVGRHLGVAIQEHAPTRLLSEAWYEGLASLTRSYPGSPNSTMLLGLIQSVTAQSGKVILTGLGGDEWLWSSQYAYYEEELAQGNWRQLSQVARADARAHGAHRALYWLVRHGAFQRLPQPVKQSLRALKKRVARPRADPLGELYWLAPRARELIEQRRKIPRDSCSQPVRNAGQRYLLHRFYDWVFADMFKEHDDRFCATLGVEERSPMFSTAFVQLAFSTPDRLRRRGKVNKYVHVQALQGLLPQEVLTRRDKANFCVVTFDHVDQWADSFSAGLPQHRPEWVTAEGMQALRGEYGKSRGRCAIAWIYWCLYVAEIMARQLKHDERDDDGV